MASTWGRERDKMIKKDLDNTELNSVRGGSILVKIWHAYGTGIGMQAWSNTALTQSRLRHLRGK